MSEKPRLDHDGGVAAELEALWTRLFAEWIEEQATLVIRELDGDGDGRERRDAIDPAEPAAGRADRAR